MNRARRLPLQHPPADSFDRAVAWRCTVLNPETVPRGADLPELPYQTTKKEGGNGRRLCMVERESRVIDYEAPSALQVGAPPSVQH